MVQAPVRLYLKSAFSSLPKWLFIVSPCKDYGRRKAQGLRHRDMYIVFSLVPRALGLEPFIRLHLIGGFSHAQRC